MHLSVFSLEVWGGGMTPFENLGSNSPTMSHNTLDMP